MITTVLIADDHAMTVKGMEMVIDEMTGFEVIATTANGLETIAAAKKYRPNLMVLDFSMPSANGLEVFIEVARWSPETRAAIITGAPTPELFRQLAAAGLHGIFTKSTDLQEICQGLAKIATGERIFCAQAQQALVQGGPKLKLSKRELEVLHCIAQGLTNGQSGERLGISPKTVDSHRSALMRKLEVHSTASLLIRAVREGLIEI